MATRVALLLLVCALPAMVAAIRPERNPYCVQGRVYCDPCRAGFETSKTTYIPGAEVIVECRDRTTMTVVYSKQGKTDSEGAYKIFVDEDHADQVCDARLLSSSHSECNVPTPGRDKARVILTGNNGLISNTRYANNMGYMTSGVASGCAEVLKALQEFDD